MKDVSLSALETFATHGDMVGLAYLSLVVLFLLLMFGFRWYVKSQREHELELSRHHAQQYEKRLEVEKRVADSLHELALSIKGRPCMRGNTAVMAKV